MKVVATEKRAVHGEYKVYTERWFLLAATSSLIATNIIQWVCFSAQIDQTNLFFCGPDGFSTCSASFLSNQIYQVVSVIVSIIGMYFATVFGILPTLRLAAIFNVVGAAIRVVSTIPTIQNFVLRQTLMLTGTSVAAVAQMYFVIFSKISESWFFPQQRASANVACSNSLELGVVLGTVLPSIIIPTTFSNDIVHSWRFFTMNCIVAVICLIPLVLLFTLCQRSIPKTPPSASSQQESSISVTLGIWKCAKDRQFLIQIVVYSINFAIGNGVIYASNAINYQGYNLKGYPIAISTLVCMPVAYVVGLIADKTRKFRLIASINACVSVVSVLALRLYLIKSYSGWYDSVIICLLLSVIMSCCSIHTPIGNEMGVETTYPVEESISTGILNTFGQTWLFSLYFILYALQESHWIYPSAGKGGSWQLSLDFWVAISLSNALIALIFLRPRYNRLKMEEEEEEDTEDVRQESTKPSICK
uniref:Major facilitator superfamily (MFS) profile domain-containing protein n=1 Tax=Caenorhabditis japonica TaxID=281687 RepID=A0A8R1DFC7_CAEJA